MKYWLIVQAVCFQAIWFASVLGGNSWLLLSLILLGIHFSLSPDRNNDLKVISLGLIGLSVDTCLSFAGVFQFEQTPFWLFLLWYGFALNLGHSMGFLRKLKPWLVMLIGAAGGSYSYLLSWKLGAVALPLGPLVSGCIIAISWALLLPILLKADIYLRGDPRV